MTYYENVNSHWGGLIKVIERKKQMGTSIIVVTKKYFLGIKFGEKSEMKRMSIFDNIAHSFYGGGIDDQDE